MASTVKIQRRIDVAGSSLSLFYLLGTLLHGMVRPKQLNLENSSKINPGVSFYGDFKFYLVSKINYTWLIWVRPTFLIDFAIQEWLSRIHL